MDWDFLRRRNLASKYVILLAVALLFGACEGCEACQDEELDTPPDLTVKDTGPPREDEPTDPLAEARETAEGEAESTAVHLGDVAREVAAEIEVASRSKPDPKPRPKIKKEPETGRLSKAELNKVFNVHADAMKKCYERSLKQSPGLQGKVRLTLLISGSGDVKTANVRGISLNNGSVESCMERQATTMKFPEPKGGSVRVNKTYSFFPEF